MSSSAGPRWFKRLTPEEGKTRRLFCFPYAGGSAGAFREFTAGLRPDVELIAAQLPGREERIGEPPHDRMGALTDRLETAVDPLLDRPFAFFGYSMGARVGLALTQRLAQRGQRMPERLVVAASPGPRLRVDVPGWSESDQDLLAYLRELGGTPPEFLKQAELVDLLLPTVRADLTAVATWPYVAEPVNCPIHALAGAHDNYATPKRMRAWAAETTQSFSLDVVDGAHFFVRTACGDIVRALNSVWAESG